MEAGAGGAISVVTNLPQNDVIRLNGINLMRCFARMVAEAEIAVSHTGGPKKRRALLRFLDREAGPAPARGDS